MLNGPTPFMNSLDMRPETMSADNVFRMAISSGSFDTRAVRT